MIYMREKQAKKKQENGNEISKNTVMNMLKNKINRVKSERINTENTHKEECNQKVEEAHSKEVHKNTKKFYVISKNKGNDFSGSESKISESIIVHDIQKYKIDPHFHQRHSHFSIDKCFDFKINNQLRNNHHAIDTYISLLEKEKQGQKQEMMKLKEYKSYYNEHMMKCTKTQDYSKAKQIEINLLKKEITQLTQHFEQIQQKQKQYLTFFLKAKDTMLSSVMLLIDTKNELHAHLDAKRLQQKEGSMKICLQRNEKLISIFSQFIKERKCQEDGETWQELKSTVKYQEKIINLIKENEINSKMKEIYHENVLMRYEINRLTEHNQNFLHLIDTQQKTIQIEIDKHSSSLKKQVNSNQYIHHQSQQSQESTPNSRMNASQQHSRMSFSITEREQLQTKRSKLQEQLKKVKEQYDIQKQFLILQCEGKEKEIEEMRKEIDGLRNRMNELKNQNEEIKVHQEYIKNSLQITKQSEKVLQEQNELLRHKIQYMTKDNDNESVTVEQLLNFLNKSELKRYHKALMELISNYQLKISQLTQSYLQQKQTKDHLNNYHKGMNHILKAKYNDEYHDEEIITYCSRYEDIMARYKENRIDNYLRQIKGYTLGIDCQGEESIESELMDYIEQLRSRMPALTEEYFEDGSSVANSSIQQFD